MDVFLLRGMPVLDATFTSHSADVHSLLRSLQQSTRTLQNMCSHAKVGCIILKSLFAVILSGVQLLSEVTFCPMPLNLGCLSFTDSSAVSSGFIIITKMMLRSVFHLTVLTAFRFLFA